MHLHDLGFVTLFLSGAARLSIRVGGLHYDELQEVSADAREALLPRSRAQAPLPSRGPRAGAPFARRALPGLSRSSSSVRKVEPRRAARPPRAGPRPAAAVGLRAASSAEEEARGRFGLGSPVMSVSDDEREVKPMKSNIDPDNQTDDEWDWEYVAIEPYKQADAEAVMSIGEPSNQSKTDDEVESSIRLEAEAIRSNIEPYKQSTSDDDLEPFIPWEEELMTSDIRPCDIEYDLAEERDLRSQMAERSLGTFEEYATSAPPAKVDLGLRNILEVWAEKAKLEKEQTYDCNSVWNARMAKTQELLERMSTRIASNATDHVFGLAFPDTSFFFDLSEQHVRAWQVQSMAAVQFGRVADEFGVIYSLGRFLPGDDVLLRGFAAEGYVGVYEVAHVSEVVDTPYVSLLTDSMPESRAQLLYDIVAWAYEMGKIVTVTPHTEEEVTFYENMGFYSITLGAEDEQMTYAGKIPTPRQTDRKNALDGVLLDMTY